MTDGNATSDEKKINLVREVANSSVDMYRAINSRRGDKGAIARQERAIKKLLTLILERKPSDEEILQAAGE